MATPAVAQGPFSAFIVRDRNKRNRKQIGSQPPDFLDKKQEENLVNYGSTKASLSRRGKSYTEAGQQPLRSKESRKEYLKNSTRHHRRSSLSNIGTLGSGLTNHIGHHKHSSVHNTKDYKDDDSSTGAPWYASFIPSLNERSSHSFSDLRDRLMSEKDDDSVQPVQFQMRKRTKRPRPVSGENRNTLQTDKTYNVVVDETTGKRKVQEVVATAPQRNLADLAKCRRSTILKKNRCTNGASVLAQVPVDNGGALSNITPKISGVTRLNVAQVSKDAAELDETHRAVHRKGAEDDVDVPRIAPSNSRLAEDLDQDQNDTLLESWSGSIPLDSGDSSIKGSKSKLNNLMLDGTDEENTRGDDDDSDSDNDEINWESSSSSSSFGSSSIKGDNNDSVSVQSEDDRSPAGPAWRPYASTPSGKPPMQRSPPSSATTKRAGLFGKNKQSRRDSLASFRSFASENTREADVTMTRNRMLVMGFGDDISVFSTESRTTTTAPATGAGGKLLTAGDGDDVSMASSHDASFQLTQASDSDSIQGGYITEAPRNVSSITNANKWKSNRKEDKSADYMLASFSRLLQENSQAGFDYEPPTLLLPAGQDDSSLCDQSASEMAPTPSKSSQTLRDDDDDDDSSSENTAYQTLPTPSKSLQIACNDDISSSDHSTAQAPTSGAEEKNGKETVEAVGKMCRRVSAVISMRNKWERMASHKFEPTHTQPTPTLLPKGLSGRYLAAVESDTAKHLVHKPARLNFGNVQSVLSVINPKESDSVSMDNDDRSKQTQDESEFTELDQGAEDYSEEYQASFPIAVVSEPIFSVDCSRSPDDSESASDSRQNKKSATLAHPPSLDHDVNYDFSPPNQTKSGGSELIDDDAGAPVSEVVAVGNIPQVLRDEESSRSGSPKQKLPHNGVCSPGGRQPVSVDLKPSDKLVHPTVESATETADAQTSMRSSLENNEEDAHDEGDRLARVQEEIKTLQAMVAAAKAGKTIKRRIRKRVVRKKSQKDQARKDGTVGANGAPDDDSMQEDASLYTFETTSEQTAEDLFHFRTVGSFENTSAQNSSVALSQSTCSEHGEKGAAQPLPAVVDLAIDEAPQKAKGQVNSGATLIRSRDKLFQFDPAPPKGCSAEMAGTESVGLVAPATRHHSSPQQPVLNVQRWTRTHSASGTDMPEPIFSKSDGRVKKCRSVTRSPANSRDDMTNTTESSSIHSREELLYIANVADAPINDQDFPQHVPEMPKEGGYLESSVTLPGEENVYSLSDKLERRHRSSSEQPNLRNRSSQGEHLRGFSREPPSARYGPLNRTSMTKTPAFKYGFTGVIPPSSDLPLTKDEELLQSKPVLRKYGFLNRKVDEEQKFWQGRRSPADDFSLPERDLEHHRRVSTDNPSLPEREDSTVGSHQTTRVGERLVEQSRRNSLLTLGRDSSFDEEEEEDKDILSPPSTMYVAGKIQAVRVGI